MTSPVAIRVMSTEMAKKILRNKFEEGILDGLWVWLYLFYSAARTAAVERNAITLLNAWPLQQIWVLLAGGEDLSQTFEGELSAARFKQGLTRTILHAEFSVTLQAAVAQVKHKILSRFGQCPCRWTPGPRLTPLGLNHACGHPVPSCMFSACNRYLLHLDKYLINQIFLRSKLAHANSAMCSQ